MRNFRNDCVNIVSLSSLQSSPERPLKVYLIAESCLYDIRYISICVPQQYMARKEKLPSSNPLFFASVAELCADIY